MPGMVWFFIVIYCIFARGLRLIRQAVWFGRLDLERHALAGGSLTSRIHLTFLGMADRGQGSLA